jgi:hypothetical protein
MLLRRRLVCRQRAVKRDVPLHEHENACRPEEAAEAVV